MIAYDSAAAADLVPTWRVVKKERAEAWLHKLGIDEEVLAS